MSFATEENWKEFMGARRDWEIRWGRWNKMMRSTSKRKRKRSGCRMGMSDYNVNDEK